MSEEIKQKPDLKELRKTEQFMKTTYDQTYMSTDRNLDQVAEYLYELTGTSITGKTVGNDFKGFGWELKEPRKKKANLLVGDHGEVDLSKLEERQSDLVFLQKLQIYYQLKDMNRGLMISQYIVPESVLAVVKGITEGETVFEEIRNLGIVIKEKEAEIRRLKEQVNQLEGTIGNLTSAFDKAKSTQKPFNLGKNPLGEKL